MSTRDLDEIRKRIAKAEKWAKKDDDDSPAEQQFRRELYAWLKALALDYASSAPNRRMAMRALFDRAQTLARYLPSIGEVLSRDVRSAAETDTIRAALAMVSLGDLQGDSREVQLSVGEILSSAQKAGVDSRPLLQEIAAISSKDVREFLGQFA